MPQIIILLFYYFILIFASIGYGMLFRFDKKKKEKLDFGFLGIIGIFVLILISYLSNLFFKHDYIHNSIIILIGLILFNYTLIKDFKILRGNFQVTISIFLLLFIGLLMFKNHDDFFYYHFQYTFSLVNFKNIFGLANMGHGFRTPSSIFYLNSLFYLPGIKFYLMNSGAILIYGFANIFFINKINLHIKKKKYDYILFLVSLIFIYINSSFYRISEHGTDKSAFILIFMFAIIYLESVNIKNKNNIIILENYYKKLIILLSLIISLKSFYLIYVLLIFVWFYEVRNLWTVKKILKVMITTKYTYSATLMICMVIFSIFSSTGCLVYPASFTCFPNLEWSVSIEQVNQMKSWYSLWSKAGANPNFRVEDPNIYLQNFNWVVNWFNQYFFTKVSDFLSVILLITIIAFFYLKPSQKQKLIKKDVINFQVFYFFLILLFVEWFINHPSLRYGGYGIIVLIFFVPTSIYLSKFKYVSKEINKKISILLIISILIFLSKNIIRIQAEMKKYHYKPLKNTYFYLDKNAFNLDVKLKDIKDNILQNDQNKYLILKNKNKN